jgi:hypothetical protein
MAYFFKCHRTWTGMRVHKSEIDDVMVCFCSAESICLNDLHWESRQYSAFDAYSESKLANVLFSVELARRLEGKEVIPFCSLFSRLDKSHATQNCNLFDPFVVLCSPLTARLVYGAPSSIAEQSI